MSERNEMWKAISRVLLLLACTFAASRVGVHWGRAEQKKWDADWYAKNPVVKEVLVEQWIEPKNIMLDTYEPGMLIKVLLSKDGNTLYIQGLKPAPVAPKPQKGSKRKELRACPDSATCGLEPLTAQPIPEKESAQDACDPRNMKPFCIKAHGQRMEQDGKEYIWDGREWLEILEGGGIRQSICWGDILVKDKENYDLCVPPLYRKDYLEQLLSDEKRLYDEGWYQPMLIGAAPQPPEKP